MTTKSDNPIPMPGDAIAVTSYYDLGCYLNRFAEGSLDLLLLLGRPGIGKTEAVKRALGIDDRHHSGALYVEGHAQPFGLYQGLWRNRDSPVVLNDLDRLYANPDCVRILKPLCNTGRAKRISWLSNAVAAVPELPNEFTTTSTVMLIANEWRSLNGNVRALEDRAIILWFNPSHDEIHRKTAEWFDEPDIYRFIGSYLLQMMLPDRTLAVVAGLQLDPRLSNETQRIKQFIAETGLSRRTYYRTKANLPVPVLPPRNVLRSGPRLRLVVDEP